MSWLKISIIHCCHLQLLKSFIGVHLSLTPDSRLVHYLTQIFLLLISLVSLFINSLLRSLYHTIKSRA